VTKASEAFDITSFCFNKDVFVDFHAKSQRGSDMVIEAQAKNHVTFGEQALFHPACIYSHDLVEERMKSAKCGDD
jgi:hypothetical protein